MTSKSAFEISSDQKVHLGSAATKIGKFCRPGDEVLEDGVARDSQAETETKAEVVETKMPGVRNSRKLWNQLFNSFPRAARESRDEPELSGGGGGGIF